MTILITGAHGQLGNELQKILEEATSERGKLPLFYERSRIVAVDVDELDITSSDAVDAFFSVHKPNLAFNCAAMTNVDGCEGNEDAAYLVNAVGPKNLALACERHGARLMHISTDYVFDGLGTRPYVETDETAPNTAYGRSKLAGEQFVLASCRNSCICRTAWLYGYIGNNFVKTLLRLAREKGSLTVVDDQVGNPTSAVDLAWQLALLAASQETGIFHCTCNGEAVSWNAFAKRIMEKAGLAVEVKACTTAQFPRPAKRPAYSALENRHLRKTIGDSMRDWKEALDSFLVNYLEQERRQ
ncbi:dTDP-4-dehydrorhamnose reductase [Sphaerochaeta globosa]|uniref:dTDP-4-dehydrorhamnose reductase n=1 Tax=Sphaerochaeta globosa (strain ATCC BAA-1886 / DSM 22777 / Buddy) TaxID=158189 RepID=F0RXU6_SPHGB|nr:dTDP-4-dehydrorhamnose reductase [Sphaerochaeta globosa]ADY12223.1 dTDP-4-dehydrorhamnose reductase [Sphaerochaeta globosa str. Buddy]